MRYAPKMAFAPPASKAIVSIKTAQALLHKPNALYAYNHVQLATPMVHVSPVCLHTASHSSSHLPLATSATIPVAFHVSTLPSALARNASPVIFFKMASVQRRVWRGVLIAQHKIHWVVFNAKGTTIWMLEIIPVCCALMHRCVSVVGRITHQFALLAQADTISLRLGYACHA